MLHIESLIESEEEMYPTIIDGSETFDLEVVPSLSLIQHEKQKTKKDINSKEKLENMNDDDLDVLRIPSIRTSDTSEEQNEDETFQHTYEEPQPEKHADEERNAEIIELEQNAPNEEEIRLEEEIETDIKDTEIDDKDLLENELHHETPSKIQAIEDDPSPPDTISEESLTNTSDDNMFSIFDDTPIMEHAINEIHTTKHENLPISENTNEHEKVQQKASTEDIINGNKDKKSTTETPMYSSDDEIALIATDEYSHVPEDAETLSHESRNATHEEKVTYEEEQEVVVKEVISRPANSEKEQSEQTTPYILSVGADSKVFTKPEFGEEDYSNSSAKDAEISINNNEHVTAHDINKYPDLEDTLEDELETPSLEVEDLEDIEAYLKPDADSKHRDTALEETTQTTFEAAAPTTNTTQEDTPEEELETVSLEVEDLEDIEAYLKSDADSEHRDTALEETTQTTFEAAAPTTNTTQESAPEEELETVSLEVEDLEDIEAYLKPDADSKHRDTALEETTQTTFETADATTNTTQEDTPEEELETVSLEVEDLEDIEAYLKSDADSEHRDTALEETTQTTFEAAAPTTNTTQESAPEEELETVSLEVEDLEDIEAYLKPDADSKHRDTALEETTQTTFETADATTNTTQEDTPEEELETVSLEVEDLEDIEAYLKSDADSEHRDTALEETTQTTFETADATTSTTQEDTPEEELETVSLEVEDLEDIEAYLKSDADSEHRDTALEETTQTTFETADATTSTTQESASEEELETISLDAEDLEDIEAYLKSDADSEHRDTALEETTQTTFETADATTSTTQESASEEELETISLDAEDLEDIEAYLKSDADSEHRDTALEKTTQTTFETADATTNTMQEEKLEAEKQCDPTPIDKAEVAKLAARINDDEDISEEQVTPSSLENIDAIENSENENYVVKEQCLNIEASLIHLEARLRKVLHLSENVKKMEVFTTTGDSPNVSSKTWDQLSKEQKNGLRIVCNAVEKHFQDSVRYSHFMQDDAYAHYKSLRRSLYL